MAAWEVRPAIQELTVLANPVFESRFDLDVKDRGARFRD
jgi:hypothetical protein